MRCMPEKDKMRIWIARRTRRTYSTDSAYLKPAQRAHPKKTPFFPNFSQENSKCKSLRERPSACLCNGWASLLPFQSPFIIPMLCERQESKKENIYHIWIFMPPAGLGVSDGPCWSNILQEANRFFKQPQSQFQLGVGRPTRITLDLWGSMATSSKSVEV